MKRILLSLGSIGIVGAIALAATGAFFSDTETSTGNFFQAGAIDLLIDNESYAIDHNIPGYENPTGAFVASAHTSWELANLTIQRFFDFIDLKPGDYGEDTISVHVQNDAWVCAAAQITEDADNDITEPEEEDGDDGSDENGELDEQVNFAFWVDDGDNVYEDGENIFLEGPVSALGGIGQMTLADSEFSVLGGTNPIPGGTTFYIGKYWCFGEMTSNELPNDQNTDPVTRGNTGFSCDGSQVDNQSQSDSIVADLEFYAEQSRNNDGFVCSGWTPSFEPNLPDVGAALGGYVAPDEVEDCNAIVETSESIQTAIDSEVSAGDTVCVASSYDQSGDNSAIRISKDDVKVLALIQGISLDVPVVLDNDGTQVSGFAGTIGTAESVSEQAAFYIDGDAENVVISYNSVSGGSGAAVLTETGGSNGGSLIAHNTLSGATQGIYLNPHTGTITIEYNDIDNNVAGIGNLTGAHVRYNEFEHTTPGSEAIGAGNGAFGDYDGSIVEYNNFLDGTKINTYSVTTDVVAPNNFFDPSGGSVQAPSDVDYTPETGSQYPHN